MLGSWLPAAIYWLGASMAAAFGGRAPEPADVFRSWGLDSLADGASDAETDLVFSAFGLGLDGDERNKRVDVPRISKLGMDEPEYPANESKRGKSHPNEEKDCKRDESNVVARHSAEHLEKESIDANECKMRDGTQRPRPSGHETVPEQAAEKTCICGNHGTILVRT